MTQVRDACAAFFEKRLEPANVVSVRLFAENLSCLRLVEAADQFLERHFSQVPRRVSIPSWGVSLGYYLVFFSSSSRPDPAPH